MVYLKILPLNVTVLNNIYVGKCSMLMNKINIWLSYINYLISECVYKINTKVSSNDNYPNYLMIQAKYHYHYRNMVIIW